MPATIKDIRDATGLSLATISKYLNGGNVLPKNKEKIDAAVEELHYQVNEIARGLVTNKTRTIGVLVHNIAGVFNGTLAGDIGRELRKEGYGMLICDSAGDEEIERQCVKFLVNKKVDGIIVVPAANNAEFLKPAMHAEIPIVLVDRKLEDAALDSVIVNNREASEQAVRHLIQNGHRRIAIITSRVEYTGIEREKGFLDAMEKAGIPVNEDYCKCGKHTVEFGYRAVKELMKLIDPPTAIFMSNYDINLGVVMALNEMGIKCPEQVSLVGFDDLLLPRIVRPGLTVMKQPMEELAKSAVEIMLGRVNKTLETPAETCVLKASFLESNSVRDIR